MIRYILIAVGIIIAFTILQFLTSIHPPRFTTTRTHAEFNIKFESVEFQTSDGITLRAWLLDAK
ncbi:MAG: hypothetical protein ACE5FT_00685 [Candidatus Nanoarchaeia archaeon]